MIKKRISNQFFINYLIMMFITIIIIVFMLVLISFANDIIEKNLVCKNVNIEELMKDNIEEIQADEILKNGGGVQVVSKDYKVIYSKGLNTLEKDTLTPQEFTDFLISTEKFGVEYCYNVLYNESEEFWLIVTFPTTIRIEFAIIYNEKYDVADKTIVWDVLVAIGILFFLLLGVSTVIYSKVTSFRIIAPLRKLCEGVLSLRNGDYSTRVDLNLKNEFGELEETFNDMADKIQKEISLRKEVEEARKRQVMYISHDLKNPLASVIGYSELALSKKNITIEEQMQYIKVIKENGVRANKLIENIFELSKLESSDFKLKLQKVEFVEYLRVTMTNYILDFEKSEFTYDFKIPNDEIYVMIDKSELDRVFQNLSTNAIKYNKNGTNINIELINNKNDICIIIEDNGIGIPKNMVEDLFNPFVRVDNNRNSERGGNGLGLAITKRIVNAHGGEILLESDVNLGCSFKILLPKI